ncbi:MAG TPA: hypothetical protein VGL72_02995 [Bryobacteraceae bacterium]|jgi:hypothetical protein
MGQPPQKKTNQYPKGLVQRATDKSIYTSTVNLADNIIVDFVWYPGARKPDLDKSLVQMIAATTGPDAVSHDILYSWTPKDGKKVKRLMKSGRITLPLRPGGVGVLNAFDTEWQITRAAKDVGMPGITRVDDDGNTVLNDLFILVRLNALGYHLRDPGDREDLHPAEYGENGERAVLAFQVDYRQAGASGPAGPLRVRGEIQKSNELYRMLLAHNSRAATVTGPPPPNLPATNPSIKDSSDLQDALFAVSGG